MKYQQAREQSLNVEWITDDCPTGKECWCRVIKTKTPIFFEDGGMEEEYYIASSGTIDKSTAEHIVKLHNESLKNKS